jgi:hypothetical protein
MTNTQNAPAPKPRKATAANGPAKSPTKPVKTAKIASAPKPKAPSKGDTLIGLLSKPGGATIAAMMEASGWQQHSVRGFLAGTVKKKLGHELTSQKEEGGRRG